MQAEPTQFLSADDDEGESWWAIEADEAVWIEFLEAYEVRIKPTTLSGIPAHRRAPRRH